MPRRHLRRVPATVGTAVRHAAPVLLLVLCAAAARAQDEPLDRDKIDITGRQNLTLGSGARAYGMGGAFLARADDATAASWNPAGLSYLRLPEVSLVGVFNSFAISRDLDTDTFKGQTLDFAALTWPVAFRDVHGAVQFSYQRVLSFDGRRDIRIYAKPNAHDPSATVLDDRWTGGSDGGFDVYSVGTGLRLTRSLRLGLTVNRWVNGYDQTLTRSVFKLANRRPVREFELDFRPHGWSANFGLMWSPIETLNVGAVYKTSASGAARLAKVRHDSWGSIGNIEQVTSNAYVSDAVVLDFPSSYGFGLSWRPRDTLTLSADLTRTRWSKAQIQYYFDLGYQPEPDENGAPAQKPAPNIYPLLQYPTLKAVPATDDPQDPLRLAGQHDKQELRVGVEWVLMKGGVKIPLRAGYFNDSQITPELTGNIPHFNGFTAGCGVGVGPVLLDIAWVYEFGSYYVTSTDTGGGDFDVPATPTLPLRNAYTTNRGFASIIYRFGGAR